MLFEDFSNPIAIALLPVPPITRPITVTKVVSINGFSKDKFLIKFALIIESG